MSYGIIHHIDFEPEYRVLIVDDDPLQTHLLTAYLSTAFHVDVAHTIKEAVVRAYDSRHPVHALLVDLVLPNGQGLEAMRRFQEALPNLPIVAMSGYKFDSAEIIQAGAQDFISKPVDPPELTRVIANAIARHVVRGEWTPVVDEEESAAERGVA